MEEKTAGASWPTVVLLGFSFGIREFLAAFAGYEDGAAVFEVLFNLAKIHLHCFLYLNVVAGVIVEEQHLK